MNAQGKPLGVSLTRRHPFRLRVNDVVRVDGRLGLVIRVTECSAVVLVNRPIRQFKTRFDKPVSIQPGPAIYRISANSSTEILNRKRHGKGKQPNTKEIV